MDTTIHIFSQSDFKSFCPTLLELDTPLNDLNVLSVHSRQEVLKLLQKPAIAIVGTRRPTSYGEFVTHKITTEICELSSGEIPIVSGFMYGIDQIAHQAAYKAGGKIIAVLAHGFDHIPRRFQRFFEDILQAGGMFISEYPPDLPPQKFMFIARNRIVAALSEVVIVPEAAIKSGSMHTVRYALDVGHSIAAVPGLITNPYAEGTKALINQGAFLVSSGQEVLELAPGLQEVLYGRSDKNSESRFANFEKNEIPVSLSSKIMTQLKVQPRTVNALAELLNMSLVDVSTELSYLELQGHVSQVNGEWMLQYRR